MAVKKSAKKKVVKKSKTPRVRRETAMFEQPGFRPTSLFKMKARVLASLKEGSAGPRVYFPTPFLLGSPLVDFSGKAGHVLYRTGPGRKFAHFKVSKTGALTLVR